MRFANFTFLVILAIYAGYVYYTRKRVRTKRASFFFSSIAPFAGIKESAAIKLLHNLRFIKVAAFSMILISLARPQITNVLKETETFGVDIILTLDVSGSMLAEDFEPSNRLTVAKDVLKEFISARHVDRLGLVVFAGKSYTQSPLTTDYNILLNILEEVDINYTDEGTAIGLAVSESLNRLKDSSAKSKVAILLTDGENNKGSIDPLLSAKLAKALGVRVYTIGIGTDAGVPVPLGKDADGEFARSSDGSMLISRLNEDMLTKIASVTGGHYYHAASKEALTDIYEKIGEMEKSKISMKKYFSYYELFPYFAMIALILLFLEVVLKTTRFSTFP